MTKDFNQLVEESNEGKRTNINLSEPMTSEAELYVQQAKYIVNANQLEASVAEELVELRRAVKIDLRAAKDSNWSDATQKTLESSLAKLKSSLHKLENSHHLKAVQLYRKVRAERDGTLDQSSVDGKRIESGIGLIQLYTAEYDQFVFRLDYLINSGILTPRNVVGLATLLDQLKTSYRLAEETLWSESASDAFVKDMTATQVALVQIDDEAHSLMAELYQSRKQKLEGNGNAE